MNKDYLNSIYPNGKIPKWFSHSLKEYCLRMLLILSIGAILIGLVMNIRSAEWRMPDNTDVMILHSTNLVVWHETLRISSNMSLSNVSFGITPDSRPHLFYKVVTP